MILYHNNDNISYCLIDQTLQGDSLPTQTGAMGSELDEQGPLFLRAARRFRVRGGHSLQWELLRHLLAEEAWADARAHFLQRVDLSR